MHMTLRSLLLLFIIVISIPLYGQSTSGMVMKRFCNNEFYSLHFVDANTGWASGKKGTILKTIDGGKHWIVQHAKAQLSLNSIYFTDKKNGVTVGFNRETWEGIILRSTDGGDSWKVQKKINDTVLNAIHFIDLKTGWASGEKGLILKTIDSGKTWEKQGVNIHACFEDIFFLDENTGWVAGADDSGNARGIILITTNGGKTWQRQNCNHADWIQSIYFRDKKNGYACGWNNDMEKEHTYGLIFRTKDGGKTWLPQTNMFIGNVNALFFFNETNGIAVGFNHEKNKAVILKTTNGGISWSKGNCTMDTELYDVYFRDKQTGWTATGNQVFLSVDGGKTFLPKQETKNKSRLTQVK